MLNQALNNLIVCLMISQLKKDDKIELRRQIYAESTVLVTIIWTVCVGMLVYTLLVLTNGIHAVFVNTSPSTK